MLVKDLMSTSVISVNPDNTYDEIVKQFNTFYITKNSYTIINTKELIQMGSSA